MPFTEYVMAAGSWSVNLDPGTPRAIRDAIDVRSAGFSQLLILPVHADADSLGDATMLDVARYAGIYRRQSASGLTLSGAGMPVVMGDEEGKGSIMESAISTASGTLAQWHAALTVGSSGVTAGTLTAPSGTYTRSFLRVTFREAWDTICARFGVEYRVNADLTLDVATVANLYGSTPAVVILGESAGVQAGREIGIVGVSGNVDLEVDLEDYTAKVIYLTGSTPTVTVAGDTSTVYRTPAGFGLIMDRIIEASSDDAGTPANMAAAQLALYDEPRIEWQVSGSGAYDLGESAPIGSLIWLYDPATGLVDTGNPVTYRGAQIYPSLSRLMGAETPIRAGMGVYLRTMVDATTPVYTDLTPYVLPETGAQRLSLGAPPRKSRR